MVEYRASHTPTALPKKSQHRVSAFTKIKFESRGGQDEKNKSRIELARSTRTEQRKVSELRCCNYGRWSSEESSYVVDVPRAK